MAGLTLAVDASATTGTIAVLRDDGVVAHREVGMRSDAEERFLPAILATLAEARGRPADLARVVCGGGPGGFTSLRVAAAIAKGLAEGLGVPLFAMPSLALIVAASDATRTPGSRWLATLDAMRGDCYLALVGVGAGGALESVEALGLSPSAEVAARALAAGATPIGPGETLVAAPHARGLVRMLGLVAAAGPVDLAAWEPVYGRLAEAQVKWEVAHGKPLAAARDAR